jgi:hypothetical protein
VADSGYCSDENLKYLNKRKIEGFVATGKQKHNKRCEPSKPGPLPKGASNSIGLFSPRLSNSANLSQGEIYVIGPTAGDSSHFRNVGDDLLDWLANLEDHQCNSDQHGGLEKERNRGDDYEDRLY